MEGGVGCAGGLSRDAKRRACLKRGNDEILSPGGREREINDCKEKMRQEKGDVGLGETETEEISLN